MKKINLKFLIVFFVLFFASSVFAITIESKKQEMHLDKNKGYFTGDVKVQVGDVVVQSPRADLDLEPETKKPSLATFFDKPYAHQIKDNKKHEVKADIIKVSLINKVITAPYFANHIAILTTTAMQRDAAPPFFVYITPAYYKSFY